MRWNRWYRLKSYFRSALWIVPFIALVLENIAIRLVFRLHERLEWLPWFGATAAGTSEALNTVEALSISFIVFSFGLLLIAIQVASGHLTAADRKALKETRRQIGGSESHHLLIRIDIDPGPRGVGAGQDAGVSK